MLKRLLPENIFDLVSKLGINALEEIRMRRNAPVVVLRGGKNMRLTYPDGGIVFATEKDMEYTLRAATENSLYAFNNQIKQGFITACGGIRIGIAGESVASDNFMPTTIKNISSIHIRIPHEVLGCSKEAFKFIAADGGIKSTLIISPPGAGKTTFLRDIARNISRQDKIYNCLVVDERFEIASCLNGVPMLDVGESTDVVSGATKKYAFSNGIRALRPDVIITDELMSRDDVEACIGAMHSGVKVIASAHAKNHLDIFERPAFEFMAKEKSFERYVVLSSKNGPGTIEQILDENLKCIFF